MEYIFRIDQIEILNQLIFDASIDLSDLEELNLSDCSLEFEMERRAFENVTRRKKILWTFTYVRGMTSLIRFDNVQQLTVSRLKGEFKHNRFIAGVTADVDGKLTIETICGLIIKMNTSEKSRIYLRDVKESNFGNGSLGGKRGFTPGEWKAFLKVKNFVQPIED